MAALRVWRAAVHVLLVPLLRVQDARNSQCFGGLAGLQWTSLMKPLDEKS